MGAIPGSGLSLGTLFIAIEAKVDEAVKELQKFGDDTSKLLDQQKEKWKSMADVGDAFTKVGAGLTAAVSVPLAGIGVAAVKAASDLEKARIGFTTMLGSAEAAERMLKNLQQFAKETPFEFPDLVEAAQRMKALGFEADRIVPTLRTVGDTAAAMGKGKDVIDGITLALGQMTAKGKVSAEEMMQLAERGVPAWEILAKAIGVSIPEAMKMAEKGAISAAEAVPAILDGMNQKFGGSMEKLSQTLTGQWSNMKDQITLALIPIGEALIPALQNLLPILSSILEKVAEGARWFGQLPEPVQTAAIAIGALATALGPALLIAGQMMTAIAALAPAFAAIGPAIGAMVSALGPLAAALAGPPGWIAAITAALVALGVWIYANWDKIVAVLRDAWKGIQEAWTAVWSSITGAVTKIWEAFRSTVEPVWKFIVDLVSAVWNVVTAVWEAEWRVITGALRAVWNAIAPVVRAAFDPIVKFLKDLWDGIESLWKKTWDTIGKGLSGAWSAIAKAAKTAFSPAVKFLADVWDDLKAAWKRVWDGIESLLTGIWNRMAGAAKRAWEEIAKIGNIITGIPAKLNSLANSIRNVGNEADRAAGRSPIPEMNEALENTNEIVTALPSEIDNLATAIRNLGDAASAAHANLNFTPGFSAIQTGAAAAAGSVDVLRESVRDLDTQGSQGFDSFSKNAISATSNAQGAVNDFGREVSTIITNLAQDISKSLWEGGGSWAEKGLNALKSLGQAVTSLFIKPFAEGIANLLAGALKDLLGGSGLGGIFDGLKNIGKTAEEVVGKVGSAAPGAGTGAAGGVGSLVGAISGIATAIASVGSFITDIIFGIQTEKDFDTLNNHTLRIFNELSNLRTDEWSRWGGLMQIKDDVLNRMDLIVYDLDLAILKFDDIITGQSRIADVISSGSERVVGAIERVFTINLYGTDPSAVSTKLAQQLRLQGALT